MTTDDVVRYYGSKTEAMAAVGLTSKAIYRWGEEPPLDVQCLIEILTGGQLRANRKALSLRILEGAKYRAPNRKKKAK